MAIKPTVRDALNLGEAALKGGSKLLPRLKPLGTAVAVISATMSVVTMIGWAITRNQEKKKNQALRDKLKNKEREGENHAGN
ncbi:MAG: hypothetical protein IJA33_03560 [Oscillospiraceae bacterium]|nr:hypothetical protein [Oscillospiraceae bacterium]